MLGLHTLVTAGARTWGKQIEEYQKGRKRTPRGWVVYDPSAVVTWALAFVQRASNALRSPPKAPVFPSA